MNKSLLLDFKVLKEQNIGVLEILYLYQIYKNVNYSIYNDNVDFEALNNGLFIKMNGIKTELRQNAIDLIEFLTIETNNSFDTKKKEIVKSKRSISIEIENNIHIFRNKWKGLKPGSMGSLKACKDKLTRWMKENPEYTFEQILNAADLYLSTEGSNLRYLQRADYFIFKQDVHKDEMSRLSAFIDDVGNKEVQDWTINLN